MKNLIIKHLDRLILHCTIVRLFFINFKKYHPIKEEQKELIDYLDCPSEWNEDYKLESEFELIYQIKASSNKFPINETVSPQFKLTLFPKNKVTEQRINKIKANQNLVKELNDILLVQSIEFDLNNQIENKFNLNELERFCEKKRSDKH